MAHLPVLLHSPSMKPRWRVLLWLLVAVTCGFAFAPHAPGLDFENGDKLQHLLAFSSLAGCALLASADDRRAMLMVMAWMLAFGIFIELVQAFLPTRSADWRDVVADLVGACVGVLAVAGARRMLPLRQAVG